MTTAADYLRFVLDDPTTRVVACYLETVRGPVGGVFVEIYGDVQTALPPLSRSEAEHLPTRLRGRALLEGARDRPPVDQAALTEALLRFSTFVTELGDLLAEVDINPLGLLPSGAVVVDALIVPRPRDATRKLEPGKIL